MGAPIGFIIAGIVCYGIIVFPLSIASIVLGTTHPGTCDVTDVMGLNVSQYLLGLGIASLVMSVSILIVLILMACSPTAGAIAAIPLIIMKVLNILFGLAWFIVGGVILYRSNINCIHVGSVHVIYALVLWCISACQMLMECVKVKVHGSGGK
jgi:hypothetical protein